MANVFEDAPEDLEDEKSGSESTDDELDEFWNSNVDCTSGSVEFIDDNDESPVEIRCE